MNDKEYIKLIGKNRGGIILKCKKNCGLNIILNLS